MRVRNSPSLSKLCQWEIENTGGRGFKLGTFERESSPSDPTSWGPIQIAEDVSLADFAFLNNQLGRTSGL
jgi:hypothetical protein